MYRKLIPPSNEWSRFDAQEYLKNLVTYPGWKKLNYIKIKKDGAYVGIEYLKKPINKENFGKIQSYIFTLIKSRYTEIIYRFHFMLNALLQTCNNESRMDKSSQTPNAHTTSPYVRCAVYVHDSMKVSVNMLERMMIASREIKKSSRLINDRAFVWPLETLMGSIIDFVDEFELNNYAPNDFNEAIASRYMKSLETFVSGEFNESIKAIVVLTMKNCQTSSKFLMDGHLEKELSTSLQSTPEAPPNVPYFRKLYRLLIKFYHDVITNDFKQLGFNQIIM